MAENYSSELPEGFKMTELGPLPEEWETINLGKVVQIHDKQRIPLSSEQRQNKKGIYPYCGANGIIDYINEYLFDGEFLLLAEDGGYWRKFENSSYVMNGRFWVNNHAHVLSAIDGKADTHYLTYSLNYLDISVFIGGTTRGKLTQGVMRSIPVPLPPLPEQKAIAKVLATIQRAVEAQDRIIAAAKELKKSLMRHLFTYGPVTVSEAEKVRLKETEIGQIPEHWDTIKLGEAFHTKQGKALSPEHRRGVSPKPFLRTANVLWGCLDLTNLDSMDFTDAEVSQLRLVPNDLLVCEGGEVGRTAIWRGEMDICCYQNHLHRLRSARSDVYPLFYMYWMQAAYLVFCLYGGTGNKTTIPNLSQSRLKSFVLPLPSLPEQQQVASILCAVDRKMGAEEKRKAALQTLFKTMLQLLMTGKIRVKDLSPAQEN